MVMEVKWESIIETSDMASDWGLGSEDVTPRRCETKQEAGSARANTPSKGKDGDKTLRRQHAVFQTPQVSLHGLITAAFLAKREGETVPESAAAARGGAKRG